MSYKVKVGICDPGKKIEIREVELTEDMRVKDSYIPGVQYDSYELARVLLHESEGECYVQRVQDSILPIAYFVDEEGRCKGSKANRLFYDQASRMHKIAGRLVIIPEYLDKLSGWCLVSYDSDDTNVKLLEQVIEFNNDDGTGPLTSLSQEDSDDLSNARKVITGNDVRDFFKNVLGIDIDEFE